MTWKNEKLPSATGATLNLFSIAPNTASDRAPKAVVQINHGMAEHADRYERFATALSNAGYAVFAHDHRGHGQTTGPDTSLGIFCKRNGWQLVLEDVGAVTSHINAVYPNIPVVCFGHSMGTIISLNVILKNPNAYAASALWNSGFETGALGALFKLILKTQRMFKGSDVPSGLAQKLTFETWNKVFAPNRTASEWLSRDTAEVDKYINDPLCGFDVSIGLWLNLLEGIYYGADDANLKNLPSDFPLHLVAGAKDPCTNNGQNVTRLAARMKKAGLSNIALDIYEDARHESINELNHDAITADFINWLDRCF